MIATVGKMLSTDARAYISPADSAIGGRRRDVLKSSRKIDLIPPMAPLEQTLFVYNFGQEGWEPRMSHVAYRQIPNKTKFGL